MTQEPSAIFLESIIKKSTPLKLLLKCNCSTSFFKFLLKLFAFFFRNAFFKYCWSTFNHVFRFFKTKASRFTNCFNYCNFVCTERSQLNVEFSLLFSSSSASAWSSSNCNSSSRYVEFLFESRDQFNKFKNSFFSNCV